MKSVKEIKAIIHKLNNQVKECEEHADIYLDNAKKISDSWCGTSRFKDTDKDTDPEYLTWEAYHKNADDLYTKAAELKKIIAVWNFNLLHAKKAELLPIWAGVMSEYQGKKIGEVREKEIRTKLHNLGISGYFSNYEYSSPKINLSYLDKNGNCYGSDYIELRGDYNISFFNTDNKFVMPELGSFKFYGEDTPYIENPKGYIKKLEKLAATAKKAAAIYDKAITEYNNNAVPGFSRIDYYRESPDCINKYFRIDK